MSTSKIAYTRETVMEMLTDYPNKVRKINLLRFELEHPAKVSPDEMLEAMSFFHGNSEGRTPGAISNKTLYIAMNYHEAADRLNAQSMDEITARLIPLEHEVNKLRYYIGLIGGQGQTVIQKLFFDGRSLQDAADELGVSVWSVRRTRDEAIDQLVEMFSYVEGSQE